jgi:hypothetical protein
MFTQILQGFIVFGIGLFVLVFSRQLVDFFGRIDWVENHLGPTQSYTIVKLIGLLVMLVGILWAGGTMQIIILKIAKFVKFLMGVK